MAEYDPAVAAQIIERQRDEIKRLREISFLAYGALATQSCEGARAVCKIMRPTLWPDDVTK